MIGNHGQAVLRSSLPNEFAFPNCGCSISSQDTSPESGAIGFAFDGVFLTSRARFASFDFCSTSLMQFSRATNCFADYAATSASFRKR